MINFPFFVFSALVYMFLKNVGYNLISKMFDNQNITKNIFTIFYEVPKKQELLEQFANLKTLLEAQMIAFTKSLQQFFENNSTKQSSFQQLNKLSKSISKITNLILEQLCQGAQIIHKFDEQRSLSQTVICQLMETLKDSQKKQAQLVSMLKQFQLQNNQLKKQEYNLQKLIEKQEQKMIDLNNEITSLKSHIIDMSKYGQQIQQKISLHQQTVRKVKIDNQIIKSQVDKQNQRYSELYKDYLMLKDSLRFRENQFQSLSKQFDEQSNSIKILETQCYYSERKKKQDRTFYDFCEKFVELQNSFVSEHISQDYSLDSQYSQIPQKKKLKFELLELQATVFQSQSEKSEIHHTKSTQDASINTQYLISQIDDLSSILQSNTQKNIPSQLNIQHPNKKINVSPKQSSFLNQINKIIKKNIKSRMQKKMQTDFKLIKMI